MVSTELEERIQCVGPQVEDLEGELYRWSLNVITAVLMGARNYSESKHRIGHLLQKLSTTVSSVFATSVKFQMLPATLAAKLGLPSWRRFVAAVTDALGTSTTLVDELLMLKDENAVLGKMAEALERPEIVRIVADLILAAGDTTAYTMEWALYMMARNPGVQEELRKSLGQYKVLEPWRGEANCMWLVQERMRWGRIKTYNCAIEWEVRPKPIK